MIRAVIVDDEPLARQRVRDLLGGEADFVVIGECEDGPEAIARIPELAPDVIFLDVQMPGLSGLEVLQHLPAPPPRIVFTTAYDSYAIRAFEANALDYLVKPFDAPRFHESAARVRAALAGNQTEWPERVAALLERLEKRDDPLRRIVVKAAGRVLLIETQDVDWFEAAGNYVRLHVKGATHLIRMTLGALEAKLDQKAFARIHRSVIVNVDRIAELESRFRGDYDVVLKDGARLEMQRAYRDRLRALIGDF
jgi:two-component system LytT family response regulator